MFNKNYYNWKQTIGFITLLILAQVASAQVYKCENSAGELNFSDEPCVKGESSTPLNWLKNTHSGKKTSKRKKQSAIDIQAKKTAGKARKNNEAYVLLSLLTTTILELETATLRSTLGDETTEAPELLLPDGITVDLLKVDKILFSRNHGKKNVRAQFIMHDGYQQEVIITRPYPVLSGETKIGRFRKSIEDIRRIDFFNSKKLLKDRKKKRVHKKNIKSKAKVSPAKEEVPVIDLDLTHEIQPAPVKKTGGAIKPADNVPANKNLQVRKLNPVEQKKSRMSTADSGLKTTQKVQVDFVNEKKVWLVKSSLGSSRNSKKANGQSFILNNQEHIPFDKIKSIRVRPTGDRSKLVVAVALKSGEIKMENMAKPFTRVLGNTGSATFNHSLLEIKSISFQR